MDETQASREQLREALLAEVEAKAPFYTPEWRYHRSSPDAGTALAFIWADMLSGTSERYHQLLGNYRRGLIDAVGFVPQPPLPSKGYLCFELAEEADEGMVLPKGTAVASAEPDEALLETQRDLYLSPARIVAAICTNGRADTAKVLEEPRDFCPFAEGDPCMRTWSFVHPYAFDMAAGATLKLRPQLLGVTVEALDGEAFTWEYLEDELWRPFEAVRAAKGELLATYPADKTAACTEIRFSIAANAAAVSHVAAAAITTTADALSDAQLQEFAVFPSGVGLVPDAVYCGDEQQTGEGLYPFGRQFYPYASVLFACGEALSKPGALVELSFALKTEEVPIEGYPDPPIIRKNIMRKEDFELPPSYEVAILEVVWEYYNGTGWAVLPVEDNDQVVGTAATPAASTAAGMFSEPLPAPRTQRLRFVCPSDMAPALQGAHELPFIRARIANIANFGRTKGHYLTPFISRLRFRYCYDEGLVLSEAFVEELGELRTIALNTAQPLITRLLAQPILYLAFSRPVKEGSLLFEMDSAGPSLVPGPLKWEYCDGQHWAPLDVHDGTEGLLKTGLLTFHASLAPTRVMGVEACFIRAVAPAHTGGASSRIINIWTNAASALARNPGVASNRAALSYDSLALPVATVVAAYNPLPTHSGCAEEDEEAFVRRVTARFNNHDRAITATDFEELALAASPLVLRCRCFSHTAASGAYAQGECTLVVLTRDEHHGDFAPLAQQVAQSLNSRRALAFGGPLHVVAPRFAEVNVSARLLIVETEDSFTVKRMAAAALDAFLDARQGGALGEGFVVGTLPAPGMIAAVLKRVEGVKHVIKLDAWYRCDTPHGPTRRDYAHASTDAFVLPKQGSYALEFELVEPTAVRASQGAAALRGGAQ
jgi:phage-related baseplate assembly protein